VAASNIVWGWHITSTAQGLEPALSLSKGTTPVMSSIEGFIPGEIEVVEGIINHFYGLPIRPTRHTTERQKNSSANLHMQISRKTENSE
jgi:hypothetical protein